MSPPAPIAPTAPTAPTALTASIPAPPGGSHDLQALPKVVGKKLVCLRKLDGKIVNVKMTLLNERSKALLLHHHFNFKLQEEAVNRDIKRKFQEFQEPEEEDDKEEEGPKAKRKPKHGHQGFMEESVQLGMRNQTAADLLETEERLRHHQMKVETLTVRKVNLLWEQAKAISIPAFKTAARKFYAESLVKEIIPLLGESARKALVDNFMTEELSDDSMQAINEFLQPDDMTAFIVADGDSLVQHLCPEMPDEERRTIVEKFAKEFQ